VMSHGTWITYETWRCRCPIQDAPRLTTFYAYHRRCPYCGARRPFQKFRPKEARYDPE